MKLTTLKEQVMTVELVNRVMERELLSYVNQVELYQQQIADGVVWNKRTYPTGTTKIKRIMLVLRQETLTLDKMLGKVC